MGKNFTQIEDLFKESFNDYQVTPSDAAWKSINGKLNLKQFLSPGLKHFNVYYLSAIVGLLATIGLVFNNNNNPTPTGTGLNIPEKTEIIVDNKSNHFETKTQIVENNDLIVSPTVKTKKTRVENKKMARTESSKIEKIVPLTENQKMKALEELSNNPEQMKELITQAPQPLFSLGNKEGCAPFKVNLKNSSRLAQKYEWSFGDGSKSKAESPSHTYLYPGVYTVRLKAIGVGGVAISTIDSIIVHESVENRISKSFEQELKENEPFVIDVKTSEPAFYEWDLGDGNYSASNKLTHAYKKAGNYTISLKTWTKNNCYDSTVVAEVKVVEPKEQIIFPNAFTPNPNGPSNGRYSSKNLYNDIFYPKVKGLLVEYDLTIFSRAGAQIFNTKDINIGWDGYYQNRLMPDGVYPYVVRVRFEGGKSFQQIGNVTILNRK